MQAKYLRSMPSLYGRRLQERLMDEVVWLKSEDLPNFLDFYVDNDQIRLIDNNENHYISGRRGTGKTHLLGAFHEIVASRADEVSIFISILNIHSASPLEMEFSIDAVARTAARQLFNGFLREFFESFLPAINLKMKQLPATKRQFVDDKLTELLTEIELGSPVTISVSDEAVTEEDSEVKQTGEFGGEAQIGFPKFFGGVRSAAREQSEIVGKSRRKKNVTRRYETDYGRVKRLVRDILEASEVKILHILVDEWMELDKGEASQLQNYFAQYLKRTFFGEKSISVKIASVWNRTSLYEQTDMARSNGIQIGQDIQHSVDLDSSFYKTEEEIIDFVKVLLYKRLVRKLPILSKFWLTEQEEVDDEFITELFDNIRNFRVFVTAGHGIPRDLMRVFQKSFQRIKADFSQYAVTYDLVADVARDIYAQEKRETINPTSATKEMWVRINKYMEMSGRRVFFVDPGEYSASTAFRGLIDHELVHEVHAPTLPREIRRKFKVFMIDFGTFVDWKRATSLGSAELLAEFVLPRLRSDEIGDEQSFVIALITDSARFQKCESCDGLIERTSAVLVKHNLCPICGEKAVRAKKNRPGGGKQGQ